MLLGSRKMHFEQSKRGRRALFPFSLAVAQGAFLKTPHFLSRNASLVSSVHLALTLEGVQRDGVRSGSVVDLDRLLHVGVPRPLVSLVCVFKANPGPACLLRSVRLQSHTTELLGVDHFVILLHIMRLPLQNKGHPVLVPLLVIDPKSLLHPFFHLANCITLAHKNQEGAAKGGKNLFGKVCNWN